MHEFFEVDQLHDASMKIDQYHTEAIPDQALEGLCLQ